MDSLTGRDVWLGLWLVLVSWHIEIPLLTVKTLSWTAITGSETDCGSRFETKVYFGDSRAEVYTGMHSRTKTGGSKTKSGLGVDSGTGSVIKMVPCGFRADAGSGSYRQFWNKGSSEVNIQGTGSRTGIGADLLSKLCKRLIRTGTRLWSGIWSKLWERLWKKFWENYERNSGTGSGIDSGCSWISAGVILKHETTRMGFMRVVSVILGGMDCSRQLWPWQEKNAVQYWAPWSE